MTQQELYEHMKDALKHFNLKFHEMTEVTVKIVDNKLVLTYRGIGISIDVNKV